MFSTIDSLDLFLELVILIEVSQAEKKNSLLHVLNYLKKNDSFPIAYIAHRILLKILVPIASAQTSFSKLKLVKLI